MDRDPRRSIYTTKGLPDEFPTMLMPAGFWEELGRVTGTFGFLEEVLAKAIFAFTATTPVAKENSKSEFEKWLPKLEHALKDQLGSLITSYEAAVQKHPGATITNLPDLVGDMRQASKIRNVLCHGSWHLADEAGASIPFFVNRKLERWTQPISEAYLKDVRHSVVCMIVAVMNTVTHMGWQFPGSSGLVG